MAESQLAPGFDLTDPDLYAHRVPQEEFALLRLLLENPGRVLTREVLIDRVWGSDYVGDTKTLDVHIKRLRTLIEEEPKTPTHISTVRGVGYRYEVAKA